MFAVCLFSVGSLLASPSPSIADNVKVEILSEREVESFKECKIRISGTYNGKPLDVTITVEADNCAVAAGELLKSFVK